MTRPRAFDPDSSCCNDSPSKLKKYILAHWDSGYAKYITNTPIYIDHNLADWIERFDFTIFSWRSISELIDDHRKTAHWFERFGGILPHPRFLVLDSPLVTYRDPISPDEKELAQSILSERFYEIFRQWDDQLQVFIIENRDPPAWVLDEANTERFTGSDTFGRRGFYPKS